MPPRGYPEMLMMRDMQAMPQINERTGYRVRPLRSSIPPRSVELPSSSNAGPGFLPQVVP
jgi:hypothetical protein